MTNNNVLLNVLGNETRRKIISIIAEEPNYLSQIAKNMDITQPAVLRHIKILEVNNIIESYPVKSSQGASKKYYKIVPTIELEIALNPNTFKVTKHMDQFQCPKYEEKAEIIEELTKKINMSQDIKSKSVSAEKLKETVEELLHCEDYVKSNLKCFECHKTSSLRKNVASIILDVEKGDIHAGLKTLGTTISSLFKI